MAMSKIARQRRYASFYAAKDEATEAANRAKAIATAAERAAFAANLVDGYYRTDGTYVRAHIKDGIKRTHKLYGEGFVRVEELDADRNFVTFYPLTARGRHVGTTFAVGKCELQ